MSRRPAPSAPLTRRELAVLRNVGDYRFLSGDQLARLHFDTGTPVGRQRRAQAILRRLTEDGYLHRLPRRIGGEGSGSGRFVYQLGYRGQRVVWPERRARTPEDSGALFVDHSLAIASLVVDLIEVERAGGIQQLAIQPEPAVWRRYLGVHGQPQVLKPDLGLRLRVDSLDLAWLVEVDRATEGLRRIRAKASQYLTYWRTGREQQAIGTFPRVAWSVPDDHRLRQLTRTLEELPEPAAAMFQVATAADTVDLLSRPPETNNNALKGGDYE